MKIQRYEIKENLMYLALWGLLFLVPVVTTYFHTAVGRDESFRWEDLFRIWGVFLAYFVVFLIHNFFLAPLLVFRGRKLLYCCSVGVLLAVFTLYQCTQHRPHMPGPPDRAMEMRMGRAGEQPMEPPSGFDSERRPHRDQRGGRLEGRERPDGHRPPLMMPLNGVLSLVVLMLTLGMNLGVKLYFKSEEDAKEMKELEKKSLEQQLAYLKYQINPHFFMNTLNNIHALVDIDPEKAKNTIVELSKMMRYLLYEGEKPLIPLQREVDFLNHYITLMSLRYTDKVIIKMETPQPLPDMAIPPLLLITFVENSFKHGVSYQHDSPIDVSISVDDNRLKFTCKNKKRPDQNNEKKQGGVGLSNVQQRLELLYGENFTLDIEDGADTYEVLLLLPLKHNQSETHVEQAQA